MDVGMTFHPLPDMELPIFRLDGPAYIAYYAPECLCVVDPRDARQLEAFIAAPYPDLPPYAGPTPRPAGEAGSSLLQNRERAWGSELWRCATHAVNETQHQHTEPFQPECLTLYLNNECNLACIYCYANPSSGPAERLDLEAIGHAADVVAASCRQKDCVFYTVFHGGGEPTLYQEPLEAALFQVEEAATAHSVELFRYIATNGVLSEEKAVWLAGHFELVGLSCDGPPAIHDRQRPRGDGRDSSKIVERTARILHQEGAAIHVRATITETNLHRQAEMAEYICGELAPQEIHFEPVYAGGRAGPSGRLTADLATDYVDHLLEARRVAGGYGIPLLASGSRPGAIHGPYCHVFRQVFNLVPGGLATACFKLNRAEEIRKRGAALNSLNLATGRFEINHRRVRDLRRRLGDVPAECRYCFNRYHCVRDCPDYCPLDDPGPRVSPGPSFRCQTQKATSLAILREVAGRLWAEARAGGERGPHGTRDLGPGTA